MSTAGHDSYQRGTLRRRSEAVSGLHFLLMFVAAGLLVLTRVEHPLVAGIQETGGGLAKPVLERVDGFVRPFRSLANNVAGYFTVGSEFRKLERELASLRQLLERTADLAKRNEELGRLANLVKSAPVDAVTVEVISGPKGLFGKSVRVGAGERDGLRYGQPVFNGKGLFGRIVSVSERSAKVLVLNDINSRIPVVVGKDRRPALVVGDNSARPRLVYLASVEAVQAGDPVVTSGASGEFPRGIAVGEVVAQRGEFRVRTAATLLAEAYLTVLRYKLPSTGNEQQQKSKARGPLQANAVGEAGRVAGQAKREAKP